MTTHLCAYTQVLETDKETEVDVIKDDVLTQSGTKRFYVPAELSFVRWKAALSTALKKARIYTPSLEVRRTVPYVIPQVSDAITFPLHYFAVEKCEPPISLAPTEELSFYAETSAATRVYGLVSLGPETLPPVPSGPIRLVRCTGSTTLVPNQWTTVPVTPDVSLEVGTYTLIAFLPISANCVAARALIHGQVWRPGVPGIAAEDDVAKSLEPAYLRDVQYYAMGTFNHINLPSFQFLSSAADTSEVVYMWLVKTA